MTSSAILTRNSLETPTKPSKMGLFLVILGAAFLPITALTLWLGPKYLAAHRIDPSTVVRFTVPNEWRGISAYDADGGKMASYLITSVPQEISFVRASNFNNNPNASAALPPREVLAAVDSFQRTKTLPDNISPLIIKYLAAHFDVKRLKSVTESHQTINGISHNTVKFAFKNEQFYELTVWNEGSDQLLALLFRKEGDVINLQGGI